MTSRMRDLLQSYTAAVENEVKAEHSNVMERWTKAKTRRAERRAALVDAIERLEANQKEQPK